METENRNPIAIFMAFGTKGDVYPIAAICAAFASDQTQYSTFLLTHSAHENLSYHLEQSGVTFVPIKSPPVLSVHQNYSSTGQDLDFEIQKRNIIREHRQECLFSVEKILGHGHTMDGDFIVINFFALEGWSLAELFYVRCVIAAPYVVPYSATSSFEHQFRKELPFLYKYLQEAPSNKVCWKDVIHWMWPLFTENWGSWRSDDLNLSPLPFTDPVTGLPACHNWPSSPLLLYGFSEEVVEVPDGEICLTHEKLRIFLTGTDSGPPIFIGLSSIGSMGFMENPEAFIRVIQTVIEITNYKFILFTAAHKPLDESVRVIAYETSSDQKVDIEYGISLFDGHLFCFSGMIPYEWLFPRCVAAIHHGGSGSTAAALHAGVPQVICPFMLDQFYWAEKMHWLGVAPEPLKREHLVPDKLDETNIREAAIVLLRSITIALLPTMKARARELAERISHEDNVAKAVNILKQEMCFSS